jgi:putative membrane protein insertion efficiency factor
MCADATLTGKRSSIAAGFLLGAIRGYQLLFSPLYAGSCRFVPSCSQYATEAILRFGALKGTALAVRRLMRCHPFGSSGLDPVPDRRR